jgi:hypothetical protein
MRHDEMRLLRWKQVDFTKSDQGRPQQDRSRRWSVTPAEQTCHRRAERMGEHRSHESNHVLENGMDHRSSEVGELVWLVTFMHYDLGCFDDETCRLEPIANPFGPKVLPMCSE